ncbi:TPA: hypothetical protein HA249_02160 [Candidatus Woesearchaeota archaeon]|nr:hypothetical protein [Candidatus Woesearchaeota archaeon]HIH47381.1 hypothetical protein [Candidatus Woesearchaeota archaeon]
MNQVLNNKRYLLFAFTLFLILLFATSCIPLGPPGSRRSQLLNADTFSDDDSEKPKRYLNPQYNFTVDYPSSWKTSKTQYRRPLVYLSPRTSFLTALSGRSFKAYQIMIDAWKLSDPSIDLVAFTELQKKEFDEGVISSEETTFSGQRAYRIIYEKHGKRWLSIWTIKEGTVYFLIYSSPLKDSDLFQNDVNQIITSFRILENKNITK